MNTKFRSTLHECKQLNSTGLLNKLGSTNITAEKILYNHAIQMVRDKTNDHSGIIKLNVLRLVSVGSFRRTVW